MAEFSRLLFVAALNENRQSLMDAVIQATDDEKSNGSNVVEVAEKRMFAVAQTGSDGSGAQVTPEVRRKSQSVLAALQESPRVMQELRTQPGLA